MNLKTIAWVAGALLYVICPFDFDFIPVVGWIDDAFVVWLAAKKVRAEFAGKVIDV